MLPRRNLYSFLRPPLFWTIFSILYVFLIGYISFSTDSWYYLLFYLIIIFLSCGRYIYASYCWFTYSLQLRNKSDVDEIKDDFDNSMVLADDHIRLGEKYIFGKCGITAVDYNEIAKVYQYVHKRNFVVDARQLRIVTNEGNDTILCMLPRKGIPQKEISRIVGMIKHHNNKVEFDYRTL